MIPFVLFIISLSASTLGAITGIGGGILVKPIVDALGILNVQTLIFLSGCMVLSMAAMSLLRSRKNGQTVHLGKMLPLALGSALGGVLGRQAFRWIQTAYPNPSVIGLVQNGVLFAITAFAFGYTVKKHSIQTHRLEGTMPKAACGLVLGVISSFLGIGGGPINLLILSYLFSMDAKTAALHSIFIILCSQLASLLMLLVSNQVPAFEPLQLAGMVVGGLSGALLGGGISRRISLRGVDTVFLYMLGAILLLCLWNMISLAA